MIMMMMVVVVLQPLMIYNARFVVVVFFETTAVVSLARHTTSLTPHLYTYISQFLLWWGWITTDYRTGIARFARVE